MYLLYPLSEALVTNGRRAPIFSCLFHEPRGCIRSGVAPPHVNLSLVPSTIHQHEAGQAQVPFESLWHCPDGESNTAYHQVLWHVLNQLYHLAGSLSDVCIFTNCFQKIFPLLMTL